MPDSCSSEKDDLAIKLALQTKLVVLKQPVVGTERQQPTDLKLLLPSRIKLIYYPASQDSVPPLRYTQSAKTHPAAPTKGPKTEET